MGLHRREQSLPIARIGAYRVDGVLGRGATATVYFGQHPAGGHRVALKLLHAHLAHDEVAAARFIQEARALSRVVHPNVVDVIDLGDHEGVPYFVTSFVEGTDLADHIRGGLSLEQVVECMLPVIDAAGAAHAAGVVHRDLKPSNIRLARDRRGRVVPKLLDFGISKLDNDWSISVLTEPGAVLGTLRYMSPEQLRSAKDVDARTDIYALGVILYESATGAHPFHGNSSYDLMRAILTAPVTPPSFLQPHLSARFDGVVMKAMARDREARFASARELFAGLAACGSHSSPTSEEVLDRRGANECGLLSANPPLDPISTTLRSRAAPCSTDSPSRSSKPLQRTRVLACAHSPRQDELHSLFERVQRAPKAGTVKGMYVIGLRQALHNAGVDCATGQRIQPFEDYPLRRYMELLIDTTVTLYPNAPVKDGLFRLGQLSIPAFAKSIVGRVLMAMGGGVWDNALDYVSRGYEVSLTGGKATVAKRGTGTALIQLRGIWNFGESYQIGIVDGLMAACGVRGTITPRVIDAADIDLKVEWEPDPRVAARAQAVSEQTLAEPLDPSM